MKRSIHKVQQLYKTQKNDELFWVFAEWLPQAHPGIDLCV
jgi:hypothetical protein